MAYNSWTPTTPFQGPQAYDFSGINAGVQALQNAPQYNPARSRSFQFNAPEAASVGGRDIIGGPSVTGQRQNVGPFGTSSPGEVATAYQTGFGAAAAPIRSQSMDRMRQLGQGFEGGRMSGNAGRALVLRNAQKTGEDLRDVANSMGGNISMRMLQQGETARDRDYGERQDIARDYQTQLRERDTGAYNENVTRAGEMRTDNVDRRNMQYQADLSRQTNQANEDYRNAGFTDEQSRYASDQAIQRAMYQLGAGFSLPQLQQSLYGANLQGWDRMQGLGSVFTGTG